MGERVIPAKSSDSEPASIQQRTEALRAENAALRRDERRYRDLFDRMTCALALYEAVDDGRDFVFRDFNQLAERVGKVRRVTDGMFLAAANGTHFLGVNSSLPQIDRNE